MYLGLVLQGSLLSPPCRCTYFWTSESPFISIFHDINILSFRPLKSPNAYQGQKKILKIVFSFYKHSGDPGPTFSYAVDTTIVQIITSILF